ncbi:PQQ-dependent sugar dehydrogenase [Halopseudomonas yangmingensis]|uniref:Glucose/arabinose dehydrogenase, beta-propeller fold n=1 Tax=Halopseudomonas yangmingensis TaxID=1720063 RepID=A0A1I4P9L0_9GAMM|nr:PQQ-dependent sugar dehydrogenase [Halopseudomonas yangmingensis]SFM24564.1 Glucose/arabinose dehydrogenase, beta-propeller fold [Halopseudomonas yangmingensis]
MKALQSALLIAGLGLGLTAHAADYRVETLAEGLEFPWSLAFLPEGGMLVTERAGRLRLIDAEGRLQAEPLNGVPSVLVERQGGLMEVALDPEFAENRRLFLSYACGTVEANNTCLASARLVDGTLQDVQEIFRAEFAKRGGAHYGGRIAFLPDQTLVLTLGDAFIHREEAQNPANHLGSIVRLNRDGSVPGDNPWVGQADVRPELYSIGHRNVQGVLWDAANHRLLAHEHGPRGGDELNLIESGNNYGWPKITYGVDYSGAVISPYSEMEGLQQPLLQWTPSIAPSGMALYQGEMFPEWQGSLLVSTLAGQHVRRVSLDGLQVREQESLFSELGERIRDVRVAADGSIHLLTDSPQGRVLRISR